MNWMRDDGLPNPLDKLGMGLGFFRRYADSFRRATGMEMDLVYADGEPWESVAGRVKGGFCRKSALDPEDASLCQQCLSNACRRAQKCDDFHTAICHAGQRFSVLSLGEIAGAGVLLLIGRVLVVDSEETVGDLTDKERRVKSMEGYQGALDLLEFSIPYLRVRLAADLLLAAREFPPLVRNACHYVDAHFRENINLPTVADACGVSEDYLSHSFSKHTGNPLHRYIAAVRTGHAMYLLREGKHDIAEIAFEIGFQSLSQFNRTFRALQGMAPGEFRRQERGAVAK